MPDPVALDYSGPRCVTGLTKNNELLVRVEWIDYFKANNTIELSLDNIYLKQVTSTNSNNESPINLDVRIIYNTDNALYL